MPTNRNCWNIFCVLFLQFQYFFAILKKGQMRFPNPKKGLQCPQKPAFLYGTFTRRSRDLYETFTRPCAGVEPYFLPTLTVPNHYFPRSGFCLSCNTLHPLPISHNCPGVYNMLKQLTMSMFSFLWVLQMEFINLK